LTPIVKENERLHKEAEDEEPMELRRKTSWSRSLFLLNKLLLRTNHKHYVLLL
jgi:hypothetical protein